MEDYNSWDIKVCNLVIIADIMHKIAISICRWPKRQNSLQEMTGQYRERAYVWCKKAAGGGMCCRWNSK
jgi:hypothetical protein